jgi:hypothetical protein
VDSRGLERVALLIQHAKRMRIMPPVASPAPPNISTSSPKRHDFRGKVSESKICSDFLYNRYLKHFSFEEEFSEIFS